MIDHELLSILRCPHCVQQDKEGLLDLVKESWLVCRDCSRKYPIVNDMPFMLEEVGSRWITTPADLLPVPPPKD